MASNSKQTERVHVTLDVQLIEKIDRLAEANNRTRSNQIYTILNEALKVGK